MLYSPDSLQAAIYQSSRYIPDRQQPDKAIDVIDEAGAKVKLRRVRDTQNVRRVEEEIQQVTTEMKSAISDKDFERAVYLREREIELREDLERVRGAGHEDQVVEVSRADIEQVISAWTGIPVSSLRSDEVEKLAKMEEILRRRVVGQDHAINSISRAIRRSRLGVSNPERPVGSFIFLGASGVGKTETARQLGAFLFGSTDALVRFDMSEYMEKHAVSKLIGSPPGYVGHEEGGQLTERIRRNPYSIVLFDEIEKAHPDVLNLMLQILDDGTLTDAYGNRVDFKNAIVLMTSNLGSKLTMRGGLMGFGGADEEQDFVRLEQEILSEMQRAFSPEFINRIDELIVFRPLGEPELMAIVDLLVDDVNTTLSQRALNVVIDDDVRQWLLTQAGVEPATGARPLRRTIQRHIQDAVSEMLIAREHGELGTIRVRVVDGDLRLAPEKADVDEPAVPVTSIS